MFGLKSLKGTLIGVVAMVFVLFFCSPNTRAGDPGTGKSHEDQEKRSCIKAVDGYAYLSDKMTLSEIRAAAFADAKRKALEMAKAYIASKTKMTNFSVQYDVVWSESEGSVSVLEQKDYGIEDNARYHVWIKAEVEYSLAPKGKARYADILQENAPLTVKVWTSKKVYKEGENVKIYLQGNRDFYARVVDITSSGEIIQLLPNDIRKNSRFEGGKVYGIPGEGDLFDLRVTPPYGKDRIVVYACERPLGRVRTKPIGKGLRVYQGNERILGAQTRGITVTPHSEDYQSGVEFYETTCTVRTVPR